MSTIGGRRPVSVVVILAAAASCGGCGEREPERLDARIDRALERAGAYLRSKQSPDGAWRSETYGTLRDGITLTPPITKTLLMLAPVDAPAPPPCRRAAAYLRGRLGADVALDYPVYVAAVTAIVLSRLPGDENGAARDAWLDRLRRHQLTEPLGWTPQDPGYGGWGYSVRPPTKPPDTAAETLPFESDLSSTLFAVGALRLGGAGPDDPAVHAALVFVERCQNYAAAGEPHDPAFDDGGFFFSTTHPVQNKAGIAGTDRHRRVRFHSYGSATADGLRALLRCGLGPDHPRVVAARDWLDRSFTTLTNPGTFEPARASDRDAPYFYWCWSLTHALRMLNADSIVQQGRQVHWPEVLAEELVGRQREDGSWANRFSFVKEDDPLIATCLAAAALANCREMLPTRETAGD